MLNTTVPRAVGLLLFSLFFAGACAFHFVEAEGFADMLPSFVPGRLAIIYATGLLELLLAVLILVPSTRRRAGLLTAAYLVLIFPANIYAAINDIPAPGASDTNQTALYLRLLFQPLLIWWVLWCTGPKRS